MALINGMPADSLINEYLKKAQALNANEVDFWTRFWTYCVPSLLALCVLWSIISILLIPALWYEKWKNFSWTLVGVLIFGLLAVMLYLLWMQDFQMSTFWEVVAKFFVSLLALIPFALVFLPYVIVGGIVFTGISGDGLHDITLGKFLLFFFISIFVAIVVILLVTLAFTYWWLTLLIIIGLAGLGTVTYKITIERI